MTSISDTNVVNAPGGLVELGYLELGASNTIINAGANSYIGGTLTCICDGSPVLVECMLPRVDVNAGGDFYANFEVDGVSYGRVGNIYNPGTQSDAQAMHLQQRITPSAGSRTFRIRGYSVAQTTTVIQGTGANSSAIIQPFLRVSKIIQASQLIVQTPNAPLVTSLPSNAIDGQEVRYLADNTNGIIWNFRYRAGSSSTYKWEFIGGSQLSSTVSAFQQLAAASGVWSDLATVGPAVTIPLAGDYSIYANAQMYNNFAGGARGFYGISLNGGAPFVYVGEDIAAQGHYTGGGINYTSSGLSAGASLKQLYQQINVGVQFGYRYIGIIPIRVSA